MKAKTDFQIVKETYLKQVNNQATKQITNESIMGEFVADFEANIDRIGEVHQEIMGSVSDLDDTILDANKRRRIESKMEREFGKYYEMLIDLVKMIDN